MTNHLTFLCQDLKLVPPGLTIKIPVHSRRAQNVTKRLEQELIRDQLRLEISSKLTPFLEKVSRIDDRTRIQQYLLKVRQIMKLEKMKTTNTKIQSHYSTQPLSTTLEKLLRHYHQASSLLRSSSMQL